MAFFLLILFFCFALSHCHFFIAWTGMASCTMVTFSITIRTYLFLLWERVSFLNREFGRCCSEGFINITSLVIDSIGTGWTSSVSLNSEQIHQRSNFKLILIHKYTYRMWKVEKRIFLLGSDAKFFQPCHL